jgi:aquaporin Z
VPFAETAALGQLWLFWLAPLIGAAIGAAIWTVLFSNRSVGIVPPASPTIAGE